MLSSEGKPTDINSAIANQKPSKTIGTDGASSLNPDQQLERSQIFRLIEEGILCFEACLYHQILPLKLEYNSLSLGIVNPREKVALDYVNSILSYLKIAVSIQPISADTHRIILSEYLSYKSASEESKLSAKKNKIDSNSGKNVANKLITEDLEEEAPGDNTLILFDSPGGLSLKNLSNKERQQAAFSTPSNNVNRQKSETKNTETNIFEVVSPENLVNVPV